MRKAQPYCKDARIDASLRVSVGLEPPPPEPAGGWTHRYSHAGDPPPSPARAGKWQCRPARTVQAAGDSDWVRTSPPTATRRPHRPGPGSGRAAPPGRCKLQVTRIAGRHRRTRRPHQSWPGISKASPPGRCSARGRSAAGRLGSGGRCGHTAADLRPAPTGTGNGETSQPFSRQCRLCHSPI